MTHNRCQRVGVSIRVLFFLAVCLVVLPAPARAGVCETWAAKAVSVQGIVEARPSGAVRWSTVRLDDTLCPGDMIRVKANGRASLVLSNDTILRLDQNTTVTFSVIAQDEPSQLDILDGIAHFISRVRQSFKVITPFVNAAVEGTEFVVAVRSNESRITVFEGRVAAGNPQGQVSLTSGQSAVARAGQAPVIRAMVRPRDAVQWALYYPPILDYDPERFRGVPAPWQSRLRDSIEAYRRGDAAAALNRIAGLPDNLRNASVYTYRASLRLAVGRVEEAKTDLKRALALNPRQSDALALSAMIAVVQNDKAKARSLAEQAVAADPGSATAKLALSYVQQAEFDIEGALATVQQAIDHQPDNALAWARLAELRLSLGELKQAQLTARRATEINPMLARTQSVLGFAYLTQIKVKKAKQAFQRAIELDQSDPLSRLGLGLATIRQGELKEGRRQIELAASLDPNNSLIRSYLGKAYYEEKRDKLAADQLAMAKELDPNDPTPWFYDAIRKQTVNRPVEALQDLQQSIELNDNRAVYRSNFLLDDDLAARDASLGRIYHDLSLLQLAPVQAWKSINSDPANYSAHQLLADSYSSIPHQEIARVSERLQAQLLQPINVIPVQPHLGESNLLILQGTGPSDPSFNEFNPLFVQDGLAFLLSGVGGTNNTWGNEFVLTGVEGKLSYNIGQFHYETDGFRDNNNFEQDIYSGLIKIALSNKSNLEFELGSTKTLNGDIILRFDPNFDPDEFSDLFSPDLVEKRDRDIYRLGYHYSPSSSNDFIGVITYHDATTDIKGTLVNPPGIPPNFVATEDSFIEQEAYTTELQYLFHSKKLNVILGGGSFDEDRFRDELFVGTLGPITLPLFEEEGDIDIEHTNYYIYSLIKPWSDLILTIGGSAEDYEGAVVERNQKNSKYGVTWTPVPSTTIRAAKFETLKRDKITNQTIEPTQIAGFNQFFDDIDGTDAKREGIGLDHKFSRSVFAGFELTERELKAPREGLGFTLDEEREESLHRAYFYWLINSKYSIGLDYQYENYFRDALPADVEPNDITTHRLPLHVRYFHPNGISAKLRASAIKHEVEFPDPVSSGSDRFWIVDASLSYRLGKRRGIISLDVRNLFDENFNFQDTKLDIDPNIPQFLPDRAVYARFTLSL